MKQFLPFLSLFALLFIVSCSEDGSTPEPIDEEFNYVPLTQGSWYEYQLDSIIYDDFNNSVVEKKYDLRVEIGNTFEQNGRNVTRMLRYIKPRDAAEAYQLQSVWFASLVGSRLETTEENLDFIKFQFPPFEGNTWKGNQYIAGEGNDNPTTSTVYYSGWDYTFKSVGAPATVQSKTYDHVAHINQINEPGGPGAVRHLVSDEWYAKDVGLIKKRMEMVVENCGTPGCSDKTKPVLERENLRKGYILNLELTDYQIQ